MSKTRVYELLLSMGKKTVSKAPIRTLLIHSLLFIIFATIIFERDSRSQKPSGDVPPTTQQKLPDQEFTLPPKEPHDPKAFFFNFEQLDYYYRIPGEFTHRLTGDEYGFESLSFIITQTHPGGGPGLHVHDTEEAHVLLAGTARYLIGDKTFTVQAPYVAKVPAGVAHTFINAGNTPFNLIAVFASKHPQTKRIGPNPLVQHGSNK